jgi:serine/threonine-protein kinase
MAENPQTLRQLVDKAGPLAVDEAARCICLVAGRLAALHGTGTVHGCLSPSNIALTDLGQIIVLSVTINGEDQLSLDRASVADVIEIADYLAPEQARVASIVDGRADIYSLGCILYFLLFGHAPFAGGTLAERLQRHQRIEPGFGDEFQRGMAKELADICRVMMAKRPEDRFHSAMDVVSALSAWMVKRNENERGS